MQNIQSFENILKKVKNYTKFISKLKSYKINLSTTEVINQYTRLTEEFDACVDELHFVIDVTDRNDIEDAKIIDKALIDELDNNQLNVINLAQRINLIPEQPNSYRMQNIREIDLDNPLIKINSDIR
ncbi:16062_t:CDS:2, partial [Dentiscutata heterogama]